MIPFKHLREFGANCLGLLIIGLLLGAAMEMGRWFVIIFVIGVVG